MFQVIDDYGKLKEDQAKTLKRAKDMLKAAFSEEEKKQVQAIGDQYLKKKEEKRIMHNRQAEIRGWCRIQEFSKKRDFLKCEKCGKKIGVSPARSAEKIWVFWQINGPRSPKFHCSLVRKVTVVVIKH